MQVFKRSEGIAGHASTGSLDQEVVPVLGSGDGLGLRVDRWFRQARKNGFDKSIQQSVECLLASVLVSAGPAIGRPDEREPEFSGLHRSEPDLPDSVSRRLGLRVPFPCSVA
jgi:hypothetical protein